MDYHKQRWCILSCFYRNRWKSAVIQPESNYGESRIKDVNKMQAEIKKEMPVPANLHFPNNTQAFFLRGLFVIFVEN
ncbi:hypothetical protein DBR39_22480 [Chryseobacterium sp. KBW03]|nr:hypothetical protein DBR39_22480 [Chryseobacterium sp. KBW03]